MTIVIYGAYGYTGDLIARESVARGLVPRLAGRNAEKTAALAEELGLEHAAVSLDDPAGLDALLDEATAVIHCAGPFSRTWEPMARACIRTKTHYLDITGEVSVFEGVQRLGEEAAQAGIMLLPGAGFDVVPSDCLAAHLKGRLPDATHLDLGFSAAGMVVSHGTATTVVENLNKGSLVREGGALRPIVAGSRTRRIDFGRGERLCVAIPWGDVSTAFHSTAIPNIAVYVPMKRAAQLAMLLASPMSGLLGTGPVQRFLKKRVDAAPAGPTADQRAAGSSTLWGEVRNANGDSQRARLVTPEGYTLTAATAVHIAQRVLAGEAPAGFQTPSSAYGEDLICAIEGVNLSQV